MASAAPNSNERRRAVVSSYMRDVEDEKAELLRQLDGLSRRIAVARHMLDGSHQLGNLDVELGILVGQMRTAAEAVETLRRIRSAEDAARAVSDA